MSTITETKRPTEPICPSWCDGHDGRYQGWETRTSDGRQARDHAHTWPNIDTSAAWFTGGASLDVSRIEEENGKLREATVSAFVGGDPDAGRSSPVRGPSLRGGGPCRARDGNWRMTTATINTSPDPEQEADEIEVPEEAVLRRELGLRPSVYSDKSDGRKGLHPDQRPCPSSCWVGQHEVYGHEVDWRHPLEAGHEMEATPNVVASLYPGAPAIGAEDKFVRTATLEPRLHQLGQGPPTVDVAFRRFDRRDQVFDDEFLRLTITDARELVVALNHLIEIAERG